MADIERGSNPSNFSWVPPTENVDGSPVNGPLSYNLYRINEATGENSLFYVVVGSLNPDGTYTAPIENFPPGRHVIALSAVDADADESALSNTMGFDLTSGVFPRPPVLLG